MAIELHHDATRPGRLPLPAPSPLAAVAVRLLACLDAAAVPAAGVFWVTTLPGRGGLVGTVLAALLVWWAAKRLGQALFAFDTYRWASWRLAKLVAFGYLLMTISGLLTGGSDAAKATKAQAVPVLTAGPSNA